MWSHTILTLYDLFFTLNVKGYFPSKHFYFMLFPPHLGPEACSYSIEGSTPTQAEALSLRFPAKFCAYLLPHGPSVYLC